MRGIVWLVSFFLFPGYYIGLSFLYYFNIPHLSRFYSVPLRITLSFLMLYFIVKNKKRLKKNSLIFVVFSLLYIFKIIYSEIIGAELSRKWFEYIFYYISYSFLPFFFFISLDFKKYKGLILNALILSGVLLSVISTIMFREVLLTGGIGRISQLTYETGKEVISPLALAYSGALTILLCFYKMIYEKTNGIIKLYLIVNIVVSSIIFFLGSTRGALIAILLGVLTFIYFGNFKSRLKFSVLFLISIPFVVFALEKTGSALLKRSMNTIESGDESGRENLWSEAIKEFVKNPYFGGRIEVSGIYPHNIILEVLMATGIIGFFLFFLFTINSINQGFRAVSIDKVFIIPILIFICGISQHMFTGSLWSAITFFSALGIFNSKKTI